MSPSSRRLLAAAVAVSAACSLLAPRTFGQRATIPDERLARLAAPRVAVAPSGVRRQVERLEWLIAHRQWDGAAALALDLAAQQPGVLASPRAGGIAPLPRVLESRLAAMPAEGAEIYGRLADAAARPRMEQAVAARDERALLGVIDQFPAAASAWQALWLHGAWALERGAWRTAAADCRRLDVALTNLAQPVVDRLASRGVTPAATAARMALALARGGRLEAAREWLAIAIVRGAQPELLGAVSAQVEAAAGWPPAHPPDPDWPQFAHDGARTSRAATSATTGGAGYRAAWTAPLAIDGYRDDQEINRMLSQFNVAMPPAVFPVVRGAALCWQDELGVHVRSLADETAPNANSEPAFAWPASAQPRRRPAAELSIKLPAYVATVRDGRVYCASTTALAPRAALGAPPQMVGLDLDSGRRLRVLVAGDKQSAYAGPVVVHNHVVAVATCRMSETSLFVDVAGYDMDDGAELWRTPLGAAGTPAAGQASEYPQIGVAEVEGVALLTTNLGIVGAVRLADGQPLWVRAYERTLVRDDYGGVRYYAAYPQTQLVAGDMLVTAPLDADRVMALDALTGELRWSTPLPAANVRVLGYDGRRVLLAGERAWAVDAATGQIEQDWGDDLRGGAGQGAMAGDWLLWPTDGNVRIVEVNSCRPVGEPLELPEPGGANLAVARGGEFVIAAGRRRLTVYRRETGDASDRQVRPGSGPVDAGPVHDDQPATPESPST